MLQRPALPVRVGCLPGGLKVLMKAFLSEAIQTFFPLLRGKEARTIRRKMKMMTIILMTSTIKNNGCFWGEGSLLSCSGVADHFLIGLLKGWAHGRLSHLLKEYMHSVILLSQGRKLRPGKVTGPRSLVWGGVSKLPDDSRACFLPFPTLPCHRLGRLEQKVTFSCGKQWPSSGLGII